MRIQTIRTVILGVLLISAPAWAGPLNPPPTGCTITETLHRYVASDPVLPAFNDFICVLGLLRDRLVHTVASELVCIDVSLAPAQRQAVTLTLAAPLAGNEAIPLTVSDVTTPPRLTVDGLTAPGGASQIVAYVFNRDPDGARTGTLCAHIDRP